MISNASKKGDYSCGSPVNLKTKSNHMNMNYKQGSISQETEQSGDSNAVASPFAAPGLISRGLASKGVGVAATALYSQPESQSDGEDANIPDLSEASTAVKNIKELMSEKERNAMLRKRNAIYSKRKYYKKKKEVSRLETQKHNLESDNHRLKCEQRRLETLLLDAKQKVEKIKAFPTSTMPYPNFAQGLFPLYPGQPLAPLSVGSAGFPLGATGMSSMSHPLVQQAYLRSMMLAPVQHSRQLEMQHIMLLRQEQDRLMSMSIPDQGGNFQASSTAALGNTAFNGYPDSAQSEEAKAPTPPQRQSTADSISSNEALLQYLLAQRSQSQPPSQFQGGLPGTGM